MVDAKSSDDIDGIIMGLEKLIAGEAAHVTCFVA